MTHTANAAASQHVQTQAQAVPLFYQRDTARFFQLAVDPGFQGRRLGSALIDRCESWATCEGFTWMSLDTAEPVHGLWRFYERLGYVVRGTVQWPGRTYTNIVMSKDLRAVQRDRGAEGSVRK